MDGRTGENPTFWEFVQGITREGINDRHWNPVSLQCNLCHVKYDYIIKLETMAEDNKDLFDKLNFTNIEEKIRNRLIINLSMNEVKLLLFVFLLTIKIFQESIAPRHQFDL